MDVSFDDLQHQSTPRRRRTTLATLLPESNAPYHSHNVTLFCPVLILSQTSHSSFAIRYLSKPQAKAGLLQMSCSINDTKEKTNHEPAKCTQHQRRRINNASSTTTNEVLRTLSGRLRAIDEPSAANRESKLQSTPKSKPPAQVSRMSDTLTTRQQQSMSRSKTNNLITHTKQVGSQCPLATQNHSTICTVITCQTCCSAPLHLCQSLPDKRRGRFNKNNTQTPQG